VDAAVAVGFALAVALPEAGNIGGGIECSFAEGVGEPDEAVAELVIVSQRRAQGLGILQILVEQVDLAVGARTNGVSERVEARLRLVVDVRHERRRVSESARAARARCAIDVGAQRAPLQEKAL